MTTSTLPFPPIWLRDNCTCAECRDPRNQQKLFAITDLPEGLEVRDVEFADRVVAVTFGPDNHRSVFPIDWLDDQAAETTGRGRGGVDKTLWTALDLDSTTHDTEWSTYTSDDATRLRALRGILQLGFALLHGAPTEERTVLEVAKSFGFVRETNYGELFEVRVETNPNNLAFTGAAISPHTDNPYRDPVPTMQLLHCLTNDVTGGESGLVDGFQAATMLRRDSRMYFDILTSTPVTFAWHDAHDYLSATAPMIELDALGEICGVRYNNRSLQPLRGSAEELTIYYDAYRAFARIIERPELMFNFRLDSGDCLIFDNTRLLHARTAFDESNGGRRHLQGCYADLDGLASTVTMLEVANRQPAAR